MKNIKTTFITLTALIILSIFLNACSSKTAEQIWVGTWGTAPQLVEPHNMPPDPGLTNNTLRQIVRISLGGDSLRVRFNNEFSTSAVEMKEVQLALSLGGSAINPESAKTLLFNGSSEVKMEPGTITVSDPIAFKVDPRSDVAITIVFGETSADVTGHPGSRTTSYILEGNQLISSNFENAIPADRWYVINGIDVKAPVKAGAVVVMGNSITDGRGSGTNKQNRWPDILSESLLSNPATQHVAVLNKGIGGNCVLKNCLGPAAVDRFERDVLNQSGVKWLIIFEAVNDIGQTPDSTLAMQVANDLIAAYDQMIEKAKAKEIKVFGATILPFGQSFYDAPYREMARNRVNTWIRNSGKFDAVIDFDLRMRNPEDSTLLLPDVHTGDFLHPNEEGYKIMGEWVDLSIFE
jgi:lysophospholipase L1-like esterase